MQRHIDQLWGSRLIASLYALNAWRYSCSAL
jgi:hypothetical protein